jgi:hypothetical protein
VNAAAVRRASEDLNGSQVTAPRWAGAGLAEAAAGGVPGGHPRRLAHDLSAVRKEKYNLSFELDTAQRRLAPGTEWRPERRRIKTSKHFKEARFETVEEIDRQYDKDLVELKKRERREREELLARLSR